MLDSTRECQRCGAVLEKDEEESGSWYLEDYLAGVLIEYLEGKKPSIFEGKAMSYQDLKILVFGEHCIGGVEYRLWKKSDFLSFVDSIVLRD